MNHFGKYCLWNQTDSKAFLPKVTFEVKLIRNHFGKYCIWNKDLTTVANKHFYIEYR